MDAETKRNTNENERISKETERLNAENARISAETTRLADENARKTAESSRISNESARSTAETNRINAETLRANAEKTRSSSETTRLSNETARTSEETKRIQAENSRISLETDRVNSESNRKTNETQRIANESKRQTDTSTALTNSNLATARANKAADDVETLLDGKGYVTLGETNTTAYRGDRGKIAYDHSQTSHARTDATKTATSTTNGNILINGTESKVYTHPAGTNPHGTTKADLGLSNVANTADADKNVLSAVKATQDAAGNNIIATYAKKPITYNTTIGTTWNGSVAPYTQTISVNGILADDNPIVDVVLSSITATALSQEKAWNCVSRITTAVNSITVYCNKKKPITAIPIQLKVVR